MENSSHKTLQERAAAIRAVSFHKIASQEVLQSIFKELAEVFVKGDVQLRTFSLERLTHAVWAFSDLQKRKRRSSTSNPLEQNQKLALWLSPFFEATQVMVEPERTYFLREIIRSLESSWKVQGFYQAVTSWLKKLLLVGIPEPECQAAEIRFLGSDDASHANRFILLLDHPHDWLRSCAALCLGRLYFRGNQEQLPSVEQMLEDLAKREVVRPGVAGPFFSAISTSIATLDSDKRKISEFMLTILRHRNQHEPPLPTNGIDFYAHEWLIDEPNAIHELINMGRIDIAIQAATEDPNPEMFSVLERLGHSKDLAVARSAAWELAYHHRCLHPHGAELGFVEHYQNSEGEYFILYTESGQETPDAMAIYPVQHSFFSDTQVKSIADRLLPVSMRGEFRERYEAKEGISGDTIQALSYQHSSIKTWKHAENQVMLIHIYWWGPIGIWQPIKMLVSQNKEWRILGYDQNEQKIELAQQGILDEVVFSDWFHFEQMDHRTFWMRIGDIRVSVFMEGEGKTRVNIERGVYSEINGENQ